MRHLRNNLIVIALIVLHSSVLAQASKSDPDSTSKVVIKINTDEALLIINNRFSESFMVANNDTVEVPSGIVSIKLSVINDYLYEEAIDVRPNSIAVIEHEFEPKPITKDILTGNYAARKKLNANVLIISDEGSDIYLNDDLIGNEYFLGNAASGSNDLEIRNSKAYSSMLIYRFNSFDNSDYSFKIVEHYIKPDLKTSRTLAFLPGFSQDYKYQGFKSLLIRIGTGASFAAMSTFQIKYWIEKKDYDDYLKKYENSISEPEATGLGDILDKREKNSKKQLRSEMPPFLHS